VHRRPHRDDQQHQGYHAVQGRIGRSTRLATWIGGAECAMVVDGYSLWNRLPGTDVEVTRAAQSCIGMQCRGHPANDLRPNFCVGRERAIKALGRPAATITLRPLPPPWGPSGAAERPPEPRTALQAPLATCDPVGPMLA
jgi:hypothetical protein